MPLFRVSDVMAVLGGLVVPGADEQDATHAKLLDDEIDGVEGCSIANHLNRVRQDLKNINGRHVKLSLKRKKLNRTRLYLAIVDIFLGFR